MRSEGVTRLPNPTEQGTLTALGSRSANRGIQRRMARQDLKRKIEDAKVGDFLLKQAVGKVDNQNNSLRPIILRTGFSREEMSLFSLSSY